MTLNHLDIDIHTYLDLFSERARLTPHWPLTSSQLNTASVYYLLDLSSLSLLSPLFCTTSVLSFFSFLCSLIFVVLSLFIRKASRQQLIRIFPKYTADTQPLWRAAVQTIPVLVWISVWLTWPETAVSLLSLQPHVPRFWRNSYKIVVIALFSSPIDIKQALQSSTPSQCVRADSSS